MRNPYLLRDHKILDVSRLVDGNPNVVFEHEDHAVVSSVWLKMTQAYEQGIADARSKVHDLIGQLS